MVELRKIMPYKLVASTGSATAILPPPLCTSFNLAEIMRKFSEVAVFRDGCGN
jgi:hypothetical protein